MATSGREVAVATTLVTGCEWGLRWGVGALEKQDMAWGWGQWLSTKRNSLCCRGSPVCQHRPLGLSPEPFGEPK